MIGPILLCHKRDVMTVKTFFVVIIQTCPCLVPYVRVVGIDGEKTLKNATCSIFKKFILLLCSIKSKKNIRTKLTELVTDNGLRKEVNSDIFNTENCLGLVYCKTVKEFDEKFNYLKSTWEANDGLRAFSKYFECFKAKFFRYRDKG